MAAVVVHGQPGNHQHSFGGAFADGLRRHGWNVEVGRSPAPADLLVLWGVRSKEKIAGQRRRGGVCVLERGYIGDRFAWTSVSFGGELNGRAEFRGVSSDGSRFDRFHWNLMRDWQWREGYTLLIGQVPGDMSLNGGRLDGWIEATAANLSGRVVYRPHPLATGRRADRVRGLERHEGPLSEALAGAGLVVTWNSNAGVEAVLAGVPTVAMDEGSMAFPVTGHALGEVVRPDRREWAARLAWCQWREEEMRSGECWARVGAET